MNKLYEILVPCKRNNGRPIRTKCHREWDSRVRRITGGLTICGPIKGQWTSPSGELFAERMIPVRILATPNQMDTIVNMTAKFYEQLAIFYYVVSEQANIIHFEGGKRVKKEKG